MRGSQGIVAKMKETRLRRGLLTFGLAATAGWAALSPAAVTFPGRSALAASTATCAAPASGAISVDPQASPAPSIAATPVADSGIAPSSSGQALNDESTAAIETLVASVSACESSGDFKTLATLVTPSYITAVYGSGTPLSSTEFLQLAKDLTVQTVSIQSVSDVRVNAKGVVSADVVWVAGQQLLHGRWSFVAQSDKPGDDTGIDTGRTNGVWLVDGVTPLDVDVPAGAQTIDFKIDDKSFGTPSISGKRGGDLALNASNSGKQDHELLVLRLPKSVKVSDLLLATGPSLPDGVVFVGQITIPAKSTGQLVLTDMPRGSYVMVDLLPDQDGIPYLSHGFVSSLKIS